MIILKSKEEISKLHEANKIVHDVLDYLETNLSKIETTKDFEILADEKIASFGGGAVAAFKGYYNYPSSVCVSVNEEVVHGIPGDKTINDGDIVSVDVGIKYDGWVGDAARTFMIGDVSQEAKQLSKDTQKALWAGIEKMVPGNRLYDINKAIHKVSRKRYGTIRDFSGHGVGRNLHEDPMVFNYINSNQPNVRLREGMVLAVEPMFVLGTGDVKVLEDGWTVVTTDNSWASHWELSVAITDKGPMVLGK